MPISQSDSFLFAPLLLDTRNPGSEETKKSEGREGKRLTPDLRPRKEERVSLLKNHCLRKRRGWECADSNCKVAAKL